MAGSKRAEWFDIEDDDFDDLANASPFFTQPTQPANAAAAAHTTQPTQVANKAAHVTQPTQVGSRADYTTQPTQVMDRNTLRESSPMVPSSPSVVEVPASSPFQSKVAPNNGPNPDRQNVASLMAPAGTAFRPPAASAPAPARAPANRQYLELSDDDLAQDYKHQDSSDDEVTPMRGDIRPSFVKRDVGVAQPTAARPAAAKPPPKDMSLNDIPNLRLRYLTKEVFRAVHKARPAITIQACKEAVQKGGWQVNSAVQSILGSDTTKSAPVVKNNSQPTLDEGSQPASAKSSFQSTISQFAYGNKPSSSATLPEESSTSAPPRRRLMQGRKQRSPSPSKVFSVSSSATSPPTSPDQASADTPKERAKPIAPKRRLMRGIKAKGQSVVTIDSDSDPILAKVTLPSRKRKAERDAAPLSEDELSKDVVDSDSDSDIVEVNPNEQKVLNYLNSCSAEELGRMIGLPADAKLMIEAAPFKNLAAAERVSRNDKSKSGRSKGARTEIGTVIVEKLSLWFEAFEAAAVVIKKCEDRGAQIQAAMAKWPMDRNGRLRSSPGVDGEDCSSVIMRQMPVPAQPALMDADVVTLKSYQLLGLNWMDLLHRNGFSGILADDMGLGKTCQVISFISHLVGSYDEDSGQTRPWPNLIVVPPSTYENWITEFERFAPDVSLFLYSGTERRDTEPEDVQDYHVVLTTYTQIERKVEDLHWLQGLEPYAAIYDEGHKLKNPSTNVYKQLKRVPTEWRLILSGTPVQNNLKELLSILSFVEPTLFTENDFGRLKTIFDAKVMNKDVHNFAALAKERVGNARTIMAPFILQRRKADVLDLAQKTERNEIVGMHPTQRAVYDEIKGRYLVPKGTAKKSAIKDANPWMQLRKAAIHHQLFRTHFTDERVNEMVDILWKKCTEDELCIQSKADRHKKLLLEDFMSKSDFQLHLWCKDFQKYIGRFDVPNRSWEESPKVKKLLELVRGYIKTGDRALVFSRFEMVMDILRETLHGCGIPYCDLSGRTLTADRFPEIQKFNDNPNIPVFLLTTGAGGTGLNLTAANKIILFDQSDNPQEDVQASNRAHRIGQTRDVEVIRIITENTVEGLVYNSCVKKLMLAACVEGEEGGDDEDGESIEEQCRKLMLLESAAEGEVRSTQL
ncbi:SMARC subfamily A containing DEAD/H box 1 [Microdochium nivale]|nr:SMARC subfamily A containing DEAD/H box 1 [Microdochium nivale]